MAELMGLALIEAVAHERGISVSRSALAGWCRDGNVFGKAGAPNGPQTGPAGDRGSTGWVVPKERVITWLDAKARGVAVEETRSRVTVAVGGAGRLAGLAEEIAGRRVGGR